MCVGRAPRDARSFSNRFSVPKAPSPFRRPSCCTGCDEHGVRIQGSDGVGNSTADLQVVLFSRRMEGNGMGKARRSPAVVAAVSVFGLSAAIGCGGTVGAEFGDNAGRRDAGAGGSSSGGIASGGTPVASGSSGSAGTSGGTAGVSSQCTSGPCPSGTKCCSGACVEPSPIVGCGSSDCTPCPALIPNGTAICAGLACAVQCDTGFESLNGACVPRDGNGSPTDSGADGTIGACNPANCPSCPPVGPYGCCRSNGTCGCTWAVGAVCF